MSTQIELTSNYIKALHPVDVAKDKAIGEHFQTKFMAMYRVSKEQAASFYEREKDNFMKRISESEDLKSCTPMSIFMAFMQVGGWKLSLEGGSQSDVYLIPGNRNIGTKDNPNWIKEVVAQPSPYGEKKIRIETGQIKHAGTPVVVYSSDKYSEKTGENGRVKVEWTKGDRPANDKIVAGFILLEYPDGSTEFKTFDLDDVNTWKKASEKKNRGNANPLYTSNNGQIDKKFFEGKILKHAFKLFPRVVAAKPLPDNFLPIGEDAVRQGFDTSEFMEETAFEEVSTNTDAKDEFSNAINEAKAENTVETVVIQNSNDPEEPEF